MGFVFFILALIILGIIAFGIIVTTIGCIIVFKKHGAKENKNILIGLIWTGISLFIMIFGSIIIRAIG